MFKHASTHTYTIIKVYDTGIPFDNVILTLFFNRYTHNKQTLLNPATVKSCFFFFFYVVMCT